MPRPNKPLLTLEARAARLPAPEPDQAVTIPLELLPAWLKLHNREIVSFDEKRALFKGQRRQNTPEEPAA